LSVIFTMDQVTQVPSRHFVINDMPSLAKRLGKAGIDRIRYASLHGHPRPPSPRNTANPYRARLEYVEPYAAGCPVDDIIQGIARLDHHGTGRRSIPLSASRIYGILQCMDVINTHEISLMLDVDTRQAQKYLKAVKLVLFHLDRHFKQHPHKEPESFFED